MADITITPANVVPPTTNTTTHYVPALIAGEAISAGQTVCILASDGLAYKADTNVTLKSDVIGIAGNSASAGQRIDVITASPALAVGTHGVTVGTPLFASATPGGICPLADLTTLAYPTLVCFAASSTTLQVAINKSTAPIP